MKIYSMGFGCYPYDEAKAVFGFENVVNSIFKATSRYDVDRDHPQLLASNNYDEFKHLYTEPNNWRFLDKQGAMTDRFMCKTASSFPDYEQMLVNEPLNMMYRHIQWFKEFKDPKNFNGFRVQREYLEQMCRGFEMNKQCANFIISGIHDEQEQAKTTLSDVQSTIDGLVNHHGIDKNRIYLIVDNNNVKPEDFKLEHVFTTLDAKELESLKKQYPSKKYHAQEYYIYIKHHATFLPNPNNE